MTETEREVFHEFYGPLQNTCFAIFTVVGDSYRLSFDEGPDYNIKNIFDEANTAFKFPPHTLFELRVSVLYGRAFKFSGSQLPAFAHSVVRTSVDTGPDPDPLPPKCCSIHCLESIDCPDPLKPAMICDGGNPRCVEGEQ